MAPGIDEKVAGAPKGTATQDFVDPGIVPIPKISGDWTVDKVLATVEADKPEEGSDSPLPYFHLLERLKTTKREGWRRFKIDRGESIADHMYRMAMMSMLAPPALAPCLDLNKCMKMCLIHDMAESLVGDITPVDGVPKPEKARREASTMDYITSTLLGKTYGSSSGGATADGSATGPLGKLVGEDIRAIWQEYEDSKTLESKYVHDIDKMELLCQMVEYEKRCEGKLDLGEFAYVASRMELPETIAWGQEVLREREAFWASKAGGGKHLRGESKVAGGVEATKVAMQDAYYTKEN
ncbi:hypothetical protein RB600_002700 [Gaeumannomyces tritici]